MTRSEDHVLKTSRAPNEAGAVRCVICGTGIATPGDLALANSGPMHVGCLPGR